VYRGLSPTLARVGAARVVACVTLDPEMIVALDWAADRQEPTVSDHVVVASNPTASLVLR
jgi:hypothetical protein